MDHRPRTFSLPDDTYPLREPLGAFRGGGNTGDEAEPKLFLTKKALVRLDGVAERVLSTHHFG
jgi:hypothetical protein